MQYILDARSLRSNRRSRALYVLSWSSRLRLHLHLWILLYEIDVNTVSYVFRAGQNIWYVELDLCISVNVAY